jgi:oligopeptide/dipeptide ABC transporter ATP-binding protein
MAAADTDVVLAVEDLRVGFATDDGLVQAVDGLSFSVARGRTLGIVGESGCGKSIASMTILGLTRAANAEISGRVLLDGVDLLALSAKELRGISGSRIAMIFQDPLSSLHPFFTIGAQLVEAMRVHREISTRAARTRAVELLGIVGIPDPQRRFGQHPHELSGGMRQRAMIAMALANDPEVLIADEPTTALDVTTQAQILELIARLREELKMATIMITHDLGVVVECADDVVVMYGGRAVESATCDALFADPQHPYTWGLLSSLARVDRRPTARLPQIPGQPPSPLALPAGCHFRPRCPHEFERCAAVPRLEHRGGEAAHLDRCWLPAQRRPKLRTTGEDGAIGLEAEGP